MENEEEIGASVRAEMSRRGVQQAAVAERLGLPQSAVSKRLRGLTPWSASELAKVADLLGVPVSKLYPESVAS